MSIIILSRRISGQEPKGKAEGLISFFYLLDVGDIVGGARETKKKGLRFSS
jgi:hypothetical protein